MKNESRNQTKTSMAIVYNFCARLQLKNDDHEPKKPLCTSKTNSNHIKKMAATERAFDVTTYREQCHKMYDVLVLGLYCSKNFCARLHTCPLTCSKSMLE